MKNAELLKHLLETNGVEVADFYETNGYYTITLEECAQVFLDDLVVLAEDAGLCSHDIMITSHFESPRIELFI